MDLKEEEGINYMSVTEGRYVKKEWPDMSDMFACEKTSMVFFIGGVWPLCLL